MKPKRILLVEDERIVAEDIRLTLESLGYAVSAVVSSAEEAVAHAAKDKPDLVLMDIVLQGKMNGIEAADQIHSRYGIPIVYLTAYVNEEILQRSKITEPYGYIIKPFQEKELYSAVEMALYKSEAEKALQASEEKYRVLFESSPFLLAQHDKDGRFLLPNPAMAKAVGFPREKLAGRKISEVFPEEVAQPRMKRIRKALDEWQTQVFEDEAGGRHFHNIFVPLRIPGKEDTIQVIAQDITRQKKMEQEIAIQRAHLSSIFEYSREGMVTLGKGNTILEANKGFQDIYGYTIEEIRGKRLDDLIVPERFKEEGKTLDQRALARFATYETIRKRKDGTEINVSLSAGPIKVAGETTGLFVIFRDITERKQAEEELKESEKRFQDVVANTGDWIWQVDSEGRYTYSSPAISQILGYTAEEMRGKTFYDFFHPDDREQLKIAAFKTFSKKEPFIGLVNRNVHKDGHTVILETSGVPIISSDGQLLGYRGIDRDITERRQAEEIYRILGERAQIGIYLIQDGKFQFANPQFQKYTGFNNNELSGMSPLSLVHPEDRNMVRENAIKMLKGKCLLPYEFRTINSGGQIRWVMETVTSIQYRGEQATLGNYMDVTEQKKARIRMEELRALESSILSSIPHAVIGLEERQITFANNAVETVFGWKPGELIGKTTRVLYRSEKDFDKIGRHLYSVLEKQQTYTEELPCRRKDGTDIICLVSASRIGEELVRRKIVVTYTDITERKQAEGELRKSEERYRVLFENSPLNLTQHDREGRFLYPNPAMAEFVGIPLEKLAGRKMTELFPEELVQQRLEYIRKTLDEWQIQVFEDQREGRQFQVIYAPLRIPGKEDTVQVIAQDITKVKKAEEELEQAFVSLAETVSRAMAARDPYTVEHQHRVAELACLVGEKMGLEKHRLLGLYIGGLLHDIGKVSIPEGILTKPGKLVGEEWALIRAHTRQGSEILNGATFPWPIIEMTLHHHERLDGSGYPDGISGDELSPEVRILGVCDVVEAMSSTRPYRPARSKEEVLEELRNGRGTKYDAGVVDIILQIIENGEFEFEEEAK